MNEQQRTQEEEGKRRTFAIKQAKKEIKENWLLKALFLTKGLRVRYWKRDDVFRLQYTPIWWNPVFIFITLFSIIFSPFICFANQTNFVQFIKETLFLFVMAFGDKGIAYEEDNSFVEILKIDNLISNNNKP